MNDVLELYGVMAKPARSRGMNRGVNDLLGPYGVTSVYEKSSNVHTTFIPRRSWATTPLPGESSVNRSNIHTTKQARNSYSSVSYVFLLKHKHVP